MSDPIGLEQELARFRRQPSPGPFTLDRIRAALSALDNPQDAIPRAIHVTGTNGKGSTTAFIRAAAEACGLGVHVFTSPHLVRVNERIRVAGALVEDETLRDVLEEIADRTEGLSYFEALTAAAFILFARTPADLSIIEVGAGGLTDATNVMARPAVTVVTPISRDHETMFNLSGVAAIARLKAGIFRSGVPAVLAEQPSIALGVLREEARLAGAAVFAARKDYRTKWDGQSFTYTGAALKLRAPWLGLRGRHQAQNAGAACAALEKLGDPRLLPDGVSAGLREAVWPARLQRLEPGPVTADSASEVWIDAAHNPGGADVLADAIGAMSKSSGAEESDRTAIVLACQAAKDVEGLLKPLAAVADRLIACPLPDSGGQEGGPGANPADIVQIAGLLGLQAMTAPDFASAVRMAQLSGADRIFICGSLYLCGAALRANGEIVA